MYLHIGNEVLVNSNDVVGVFDMEKASTSKNTKEFLNNAAKMKRVRYVSLDMPKSFVVCLDKDLTENVYVTNISCQTILKRLIELNNKKII